MPREKTRDALEIIDRRYFKTRKAKAMLEEARASAEVARLIYQLREEAGLTQAELARLVGTSRTVITRLEDDDYEGHLLCMLRRVAAAVGKRVEIRFVPVRKGERAA